MNNYIRAILRENVTVEQILNALQDKCAGVDSVGLYGVPGLFQVYFTDKDKEQPSVKEYRYMLVNTDFKENNLMPGIECKLQHWGNSAELLKYLCEQFGGYTQNSPSEEMTLYNKEEYDTGKPYTEIQRLQNEILHRLDLDAVPVVVELCEKYKNAWSVEV